MFRTTAPYEAPAIVERTEIDMPLIGTAPASTRSAAFRTTRVYEAPAIVERTQVGTPLVLANPSNPG